ncbi:hypothetical protein WJX74_008515 [Apatococcus lobatus]|uniref:RING-type domain-containing protein n=1 Tax=Apatococcus lobatus TaxID=904363 RepID=A0AAW1QJU2_9CHLO
MAPGRPAECPFHTTSISSSTPPIDTNVQPGQAPSARCPFSAHVANSEAIPQGSQAVPAEEVLGQPQQQPEAVSGQPATCPYGFGSAKSSSKPLHCPRCNALYHDVVRLNCSHTFCSACIAPCQDCLLCGEGITSRQPDAEIQGHVDEYMAAAGVCSRPGQAQEAAEQVGGMDVRAAFWLQEGMRSLSGGNSGAALHRLEVSHHQLERLAAEAGGAGPSAAAAVQLGAVRGACGDCCQQLGNPEAAAGHYQASAAHLCSCWDQSQEVQQALAVSQNKLGDLHYTYGHLEQALECYQAALQVRRLAADCPVSQATVDQHLSLATSLVKLVDLEHALGHQGAAARSALEAQQVLQTLKAECQLSDAVEAKTAKLECIIKTSQMPAEQCHRSL